MVRNGGEKNFYVHFEGLTTDSYFGKTNLLGEGCMEKRLFYHSSDEKKNMITDLSSGFKMVKNGD